MYAASDPPDGPADVGLLSPVSAGTAVEQLTGDHAVARAMLHVEAALLHALVRAGVAPAGLATDALDAVVVDPRTLALDAVADGNPVIPLVAHLRAVTDEQTARWVHHGATSQDIIDTALMLIGGAVARQLERDLIRLAHHVGRLAGETRSVPIVARTLAQQALPSTFGMRAAGWLACIHDAVRQIRTCTTPPVSLGGPVGTAAAYGAAGPAVLDAFAARLELSAPVSSWHTRRTPVLASATACAVVTAMCGKIAADVLVMGQTEVGEARPGSPGGSSSMPHKQNASQAMLVVAAARQAPAHLTVITAAAAAEQERPAGAWHAEWQPLRTVWRLAGGAVERTATMLAEVRFDQQAMRRNLDTLVASVAEDQAWVDRHTAHVDVWIDRVLDEHRSLIG